MRLVLLLAILSAPVSALAQPSCGSTDVAIDGGGCGIEAGYGALASLVMSIGALGFVMRRRR